MQCNWLGTPAAARCRVSDWTCEQCREPSTGEVCIWSRLAKGIVPLQEPERARQALLRQLASRQA